MLIVNVSVWESPEVLASFVYGGEHLAVMRQRREWFHHMAEAFTVLWWVPTGHEPTPDEARSRLEQLRREGPTARAFTLKQPFPAPGSAITPAADDRLCPA